MIRTAARRFASSSPMAKAQAGASKAFALAEPVLYYGRVAGEFLAQIAKHQNLLTPGSWAEANTGLGNFVSSLRNGAWRKVTLEQARPFAGAGLQLTGFFVVGEMVGRQSVIGYKTPSSHHH